MTDTPKRKLIEVGIPLKTINEESAREKSIRHGHPSTLHLWWARRPLAAARAVLFAQLVDDPSSHPEKFPSYKDVVTERKRLHALMEQLVLWENSKNEALLAQAHHEIMESTGGNPPPILDPFSGGGTIPLEAQRLGLEAHASDLNPVAVLITKALIEIPPKFAGRSPVSPGVARDQLEYPWPDATGIAEDVRRYGQWMRDEAEKRIGHLYPRATMPDGSLAPVIAWLWARTIACPNPACGIAMPLVRSWWLSKKKGGEAYIIPAVADRKVQFSIGYELRSAPADDGDGTVGRSGARCVGCGAVVGLNYVRAEGRAGRIGQQLMTTVAEVNRRRIYLAPTPDQESAAIAEPPEDFPAGELSTHPQYMGAPRYGMKEFADLFTVRQLTALTTFSGLVIEAREVILNDALAAGMPEGDPLESGGTGAAAYADAVTTYLGFGVSRLADIANALCAWENTKTQIRHLFTRQAIPMVWDFAESTPFGQAAGSFVVSLNSVAKAIQVVGAKVGEAHQASASERSLAGFLISTDPPYYDNIPYSDLSDFFYVWLRRSLHKVYPDLLSTILVPKSEELVANSYRLGGREAAQKFFEDGFREVFTRARMSALPDYPITVYYAFKQTEKVDEGSVSTGWETLLDGMIGSGWSVTATWPLRSELSNRMRSLGSNALASSIVLALRPRRADALRTDRRRFIATLKAELPSALKELQQGAIAPVDLPQAAIGPGMAVFSRYSAVLEDDGSNMSVRTALAQINEVLDEVLNAQEGDFDPDTRFAIVWFRQFGFESGPFGSAETIANARNASVDHLDQVGILTSRAGKVNLIAPDALPTDYEPATDTWISTWEVVMHLTRALAKEGIPSASALLERVPASIERDLCKELAFLLFSISETRKQTRLAVDFNALGTAWNEIAAGASRADSQPTQSTIDFGED